MLQVSYITTTQGIWDYLDKTITSLAEVIIIQSGIIQIPGLADLTASLTITCLVETICFSGTISSETISSAITCSSEVQTHFQT